MSKILVVDDKPENIKVIQVVLEKVSAEIIEAGSGREALTQILRHEFALILLDVQMPEMDGFETAKLIRSNKKTRDIPIIFVTALPEQDKKSAFAGYESGAVDYLPKPIETHVLVSKVNVFLDIYNYKNTLEQEIIRREIAELEVTRIIENIKDGLITLDQNRAIRYINPAGLFFLGDKDENIRNKSIEDLCSIYDKKIKINLDDEISKVLKHGETIKFKRGSTLINKKNKSFVIAGQISSISNEDNILGVIITIQDIKNLMEMEYTLAQSEKFKSLRVMSSGVANEIRNPLGMMIQSGQNVLRRLDPSMPKNIEIARKNGVDIAAMSKYIRERRIDEFVENIRVAGDRASNIIMCLLQLTKESTNVKTKNKLPDIVEESIKLIGAEHQLTNQVKFSSINVEKNYQKKLPRVSCNITELVEAIYNILKNSAYALNGINDEPNIKIDIFTSDDDNYINLEITDNGLGIDDDYLERVFEPFFTTKNIGEGIGLGLTVAYTIIAHGHKGTIDFASKKNKGTKVSISLPVNS